ncbi:hypothetical protein EDD15DRAFT_2110694, partial [Pisolithus albus]
ELVQHMQTFCDARDLLHLAATSRRMSQLVRAYLKLRVCAVGERYFSGGAVLFHMLHTCDAIISGSTALHILLPEDGTPWIPRDLDLYVPEATSGRLLSQLALEGYTSAGDVDLTMPGYPHGQASRQVVLTKGAKAIDIIVSSTCSAIGPILQFHSTAVMNFISADTIFSCYPSLTLR